MGKIFCPGVAQSDGGIGLASREQGGDGFAHDVAASYHDGVLPGDVKSGRLYQLQYAVRSARKKALLADHHASDVNRRESVNVFFRGDRVYDLVFVEALRQRKLHQNSVYGGVGIQLRDCRKQLAFRSRRWHSDLSRHDSSFGACLLLRRHVADARGIVPDEYHG